MKAIQLTCTHCNAPLFPAYQGDDMILICPYCGHDTRIMPASDRVRIARFHAEAELARLALTEKNRQEDQAAARRLFRIRTGIICAVSLIVAILTVIWLSS